MNRNRLTGRFVSVQHLNAAIEDCRSFQNEANRVTSACFPIQRSTIVFNDPSASFSVFLSDSAEIDIIYIVCRRNADFLHRNNSGFREHPERRIMPMKYPKEFIIQTIKQFEAGTSIKELRTQNYA